MGTVIIAVMHLFLIAFGYVTTCGHGYYCRDAFVLDCFWLLVKVANDESHTHIFSSRLPTMHAPRAIDVMVRYGPPWAAAAMGSEIDLQSAAGALAAVVEREQRSQSSLPQMAETKE